jgi:PAS domain S-box-containing protein
LSVLDTTARNAPQSESEGTPPSRSAVLRVVLPYVVFAGLWILLSDRLLAALLPDPAERMRWSMLKGLAFVLVTALLLSALLARELRARAQAEAARRESEDRLRFALQRSQTGGWELDLEDHSVRRTPEHDRIFGYDTPLPRWTYEMFLAHVVPEDREPVDRRFHEALRSGSDWSFECRIRRRDGELRWIWATLGLHVGSNGNGRRLAGIVQDVTERHRVQAERQALDDQLRQAQKLDSVGRLAGGVAHDFNNLLGVILGHGELLLRQASEEQRPRLEQVLSAAERAAGLTRQLLAFSRRQVVEPRVLDPNLLLSDLQKMLGRLIGEDVELVTVLGTGLGCVRADPGQLEQVVMNLCVNARDAMPDGGVLRLETAGAEVLASDAGRDPALPPGRYVTLTVSDTGAGIERDVLPRIFEPFFTTKELGRGTGLGLATVYGIVRQAGGAISVSSELDRGSAFTVFLPRVDTPAPPARATPEAPASARGSETILLVEDEASLRAITRQGLEEHGYRVLEATSATEALDLAAGHDGPIPLLLTDVVLPGLNGRQLADALVASRPGLAVLYVSGYAPEAVLHRGVLLPGTLFLPKPYTVPTLLRRVREAIDGAAAKSAGEVQRTP